MTNVTLSTPIGSVRVALREQHVSREDGRARFVAGIQQSMAIEGYNVSEAMVRAALPEQK